MEQLALEHPVDIASRLAGGRNALAAHLGVRASAVGNWKVRGVPIEHCVPIERLTGVSRRALRPDDWHEIWPELAANDLAQAKEVANA